MHRSALALAVAFAAGVIRPATPSIGDRLNQAESKRRIAAAEAKRVRRRARNLKQETTP